MARRQLGVRLRTLRIDAGKSMQSVAAAKLFSESKLARIENGKAAVKVGDVWTLCRFYGATNEVTDALAKLAEGTSTDGWWEDDPDAVPEWLRMYIGLEGSCGLHESYHPEMIHGLFQTEDYARAVILTDGPKPDEVIERQLKLRAERWRAAVDTKPGRDIRLILGFAALQLNVGSPEIMSAQIAHLREVNTTVPGIDIRVLPSTIGAHPGLSGRFTLMDFESREDPSVIYLESLTGGRYLELPRQVNAYRKVFDTLHHISQPIEEYTA